MKAVQATHVLAIASCLTTEALSVGTVLDWQLLLVENHIAIDIGDWHLGSWDEVEIVDLAVIHLTLLVRELASAVARCLVDHCRRHDFSISRLVSLSEEEVDERTLQTGTLTDINREASTSDLHTKVEVDEVVFLCKFPVRELGRVILWVAIPVAHCILTHYTFLEVRLNHPVVLGTSSFRHLIVRDVRNLAEHCSDLGLQGIHLFLKTLAFALEFSHLCLSLLSLSLLTVLHECTDILGKSISLCQILVERLLGCTTLSILGDDSLDGFLGTSEVLLIQTGNDTFGLLGNQFQSQHVSINNYQSINIK